MMGVKSYHSKGRISGWTGSRRVCRIPEANRVGHRWKTCSSVYQCVIKVTERQRRVPGSGNTLCEGHNRRRTLYRYHSTQNHMTQHANGSLLLTSVPLFQLRFEEVGAIFGQVSGLVRQHADREFVDQPQYFGRQVGVPGHL